MKLNKRLISGILAIVTVAGLSGCQSKNNEQDNAIPEVVMESDQDVPLPNVEENDIEVTLCNQSGTEVESFLKENYYDSDIDYQMIIKSYSEDYDLKMSDMDTYFKAIYMRLYNSGIEMDKFLVELNSMLVLGQVPMCLPDDVWVANFSSLISTLKENESLYDVYVDFAIMVHELTCEMEHNENEYYAYSCEDLEDQYKLIRDNKKVC